MFSGSDHMRSARGPQCGIYCFLSSNLIWSMVGKSGESPPCTQSTLPLTIAPSGRQSKASQKYFQQFEFPYFLLIQSKKPYIIVTLRLSWLPLSKYILSGYFTLRQNSKVIVSTEWYPLSTKSPIIINLLYGTPPPFESRFLTSKNWPWTSPAKQTGASTVTMLDSSARIALTILQRERTADSVMGWQLIADSYHCSILIYEYKQTIRCRWCE